MLDKFSCAEIVIKDLRLRTFIGIKQEEIDNKQDVIINIRIGYDCENASQSDDVLDALNYRTITKKIIDFVENNKFSLLERMVKDVLSIIAQNKQVIWSEVSIDKPFALRYADSVGLKLGFKR